MEFRNELARLVDDDRIARVGCFFCAHGQEDSTSSQARRDEALERATLSAMATVPFMRSMQVPGLLQQTDGTDSSPRDILGRLMALESRGDLVCVGADIYCLPENVGVAQLASDVEIEALRLAVLGVLSKRRAKVPLGRLKAALREAGFGSTGAAVSRALSVLQTQGLVEHAVESRLVVPTEQLLAMLPKTKIDTARVRGREAAVRETVLGFFRTTRTARLGFTQRMLREAGRQFTAEDVAAAVDALVESRDLIRTENGWLGLEANREHIDGAERQARRRRSGDSASRWQNGWITIISTPMGGQPHR